MSSSDQVRVLHLVGGKFFQGGTASVVRDLVTASAPGVENWIWVHRECSEEAELPFVRKGAAQVVSATFLADFVAVILDLSALLRTIKQLNISVLHAHTRYGIFAGWLTRQVTGTPLVIHLHSLARRPWLYRFLARTAGATVIYNSHRTREYYRGDRGSAHVIMPTFEWPMNEGAGSPVQRIVAASAFVSNKRLDVIIEACRLLQNSEAPPSLVVYGLLPGPIAPATQKKIVSQYGRLGFVTFKEWTRNWADLLGSKDIFIHISDSEAFGLTILEAFARGSRLVLSRPSFLETLDSEIADKGVYYVNDLSAQNVSETIRIAINDPIETHLLRQLRCTVASQFSKDTAANRVRAIYQSVV